MYPSKNSLFSLRAAVGLLALTTMAITVAQAKPHHAQITVKQANATVLKRFGGHIVGKTPLENEEGKWQYGVSVQSGATLREVMVDANTGRIVDIEVTTAAKERAEAIADKKQAALAKKHH